ncbi:MAG: hypothetical protein IPG56_20225 [Caulobacteraceae bacterium]|nr:hypothetical protein [Caulobacteraceae bacterium]
MARNRSRSTHRNSRRAPRPRAFGTQHTDYDGEDDWGVNGGASRTSDPTRLAQRIESIERRTQLAVTGLDRAVSTIDRSVLVSLRALKMRKRRRAKLLSAFQTRWNNSAPPAKR